MEKLVFERTLPIQGEPVNVYVHGSRGKSGQLVLTYEEWLHFNKLIREGMDSLKRKNETRIEIAIKGIEGPRPKIFPQVQSIGRKVSDAEVEEILDGIDKEALDFDEEDKAEISKAEKEQGLVRSLLPEGKEI